MAVAMMALATLGGALAPGSPAVAAGDGALSSARTSPVARLLADVPSYYSGCGANPKLNLGGASVIFRYKAIAEVDCGVEGHNGVSLVVYMLYPSDKAMNAAFQHVWVKQVARPKASLGCPRHSFASAVCNYWIGNSHAAAGQFVRFLFRYSVDSYLIPSVAWTSDRDGIICYLAGTKTNDTQQVLNYWATGAPGPS